MKTWILNYRSFSDLPLVLISLRIAIYFMSQLLFSSHMWKKQVLSYLMMAQMCCHFGKELCYNVLQLNLKFRINIDKHQRGRNIMHSVMITNLCRHVQTSSIYWLKIVFQPRKIKLWALRVDSFKIKEQIAVKKKLPYNDGKIS